MATRNAEATEAARTEKRGRILRAAIDVFAQTGYFNAKVADIAKAAGVADGTIYLYFLGKEDLLISIFRDYMRRFIDSGVEKLESIGDPRERLRGIIRHHLKVFGEDRALAVVFQVELRQSLKFMTLFSHQEFAEYLNLIRDAVAQGCSKGAFRASLQPQLTAKAVFGVLDEMVTSWVLSERTYKPDDQIEEISDFILHGLC